jgi:hypothetical protein
MSAYGVGNALQSAALPQIPPGTSGTATSHSGRQRQDAHGLAAEVRPDSAATRSVVCGLWSVGASGLACRLDDVLR